MKLLEGDLIPCTIIKNKKTYMKIKKIIIIVALFISVLPHHINGKQRHFDKTNDSIIIVNNSVRDTIHKLYKTNEFGENIQYNLNKDIKIKTKQNYEALNQTLNLSPQPKYWLHKGKTYNILREKENIVMLDTCENIQAVEAMFFVNMYDFLYSEQKTIIERFEQRINMIENGSFNKECKELMDKKNLFLEQEKNKISDIFYSLCKHLFLIEYLSDMEFSFNRGSEEAKKILFEYKGLIQMDDLLFEKSYKQFCYGYNSFLTKIEESESSANNLTNQYISAKKNFTGQTRDYLLFVIVQVAINKNTNEDLVTSFFNDCEGEDYKDFVKKILNVDKNISQTTKDSIFTLDLKQISLSSLFEKCKGKIIYLDFWASWCAPCRVEMPKSTELKEKYKDQVVFLYISLDKDTNAWLRASEAENLDNSCSFLIQDSSEFIQKLNVKSIPRYMFFDREGILIDDHAMRPSNKDFDTKVNEFIEKY
jgi:thiol-disulfide isomerase/thioredoxin